MAIDGHFHLYKSETAGLQAQGGASLLGYAGILPEAEKILAQGRFESLVAVAVIPLNAMRKAAQAKWDPAWPEAKREEERCALEAKLTERLIGYNDWLCEAALKEPRLWPLPAAEPSLSEADKIEEIETRMARYRIRGLKIHPAVGGVYPDDPAYRSIYRLAEKYDLTVLAHGGLNADDPEGRYCHPRRFRAVLAEYPKLRLVVAHLAYPHTQELISLFAEYPHLYTDLSFILTRNFFSEEELKSIIRAIGPQRIVFGSDFPWADPDQGRQALDRLGLNPEALRLLLSENAALLYGR